jgi:hypothetical protein
MVCASFIFDQGGVCTFCTFYIRSQRGKWRKVHRLQGLMAHQNSFLHLLHLLHLLNISLSREVLGSAAAAVTRGWPRKRDKTCKTLSSVKNNTRWRNGVQVLQHLSHKTQQNPLAGQKRHSASIWSATFAAPFMNEVSRPSIFSSPNGSTIVCGNQ